MADRENGWRPPGLKRIRKFAIPLKCIHRYIHQAALAECQTFRVNCSFADMFLNVSRYLYAKPTADCQDVLQPLWLNQLNNSSVYI
jgi:hypothetical protein